LAAELLRREMNQADFARAIGASSGRVSEWLAGKRRPSTDSLGKIAEALPGVSLDALLVLAGHREPDEPIEADDPRRELLTLVKMLRVTPDRQVGLRHLMRGWIDEDRKQGKPQGQ
jgi:transcriptional regulator with XRE-family HTH domain